MARPSTLGSVANAARVLKEFGKGERDLGVTELSRRLGLGKSTVHRLVSTLAGERLLDRDPATGSYRLGLAMYDLGASVALHREIHQVASPVLESLRLQTRESVQIGVQDGREVVYVERVESPQSVRTFVRIGHRNWCHCTATGKVLLAFLSREQLAVLLDGWELPRKTDATIVEIDALIAELERVRKRGYSTNVDEAEPGHTSIGAPVRDSRGEVVAALSVVGPTMRINRQAMRTLSGLVVEGAGTISQRLGYRTNGSRGAT